MAAKLIERLVIGHYLRYKSDAPGKDMLRAMTCHTCGKTVGGASARHSFCLPCLLQQAAEMTPEAANHEQKGFSARTLPVKFGPYDLLEELGRGGMGVVFKARRRGSSEPLALKLLPPVYVESECLRCLRAEVAAGVALRHPGIVSIHEVGVEQQRPYVVMDYVSGESLALKAQSHPVAWQQAARYTCQTAGAIHYAHEHELLHGDLKPSNVLVDPQDNARITDFGLTQRLGTKSGLHKDRQVLGSPLYMAPEKLRTRWRTDCRSDIYGVGAILYYLLTGRPPFMAESVEDLFQLVLNTAPVPPRLLNPTVPSVLETICLKCLEKDANRRFDGADELAEELKVVSRT